MNEMQQAARRLHALGFATLPIKPGTKEPATAHGVKDATRDDAVTDAFYEHNPSYGIGVSGEGFVIFDFDVKNGIDGRDQLTGWKLPDTLCQTTPSGGYHMIYRTAEDVRPSVNSEMAVDVRGWHSYVVCDPTPGYYFEDDEAEIADANDDVMAFLEHVRPKKKKIPPFKAPSHGTTKTKEGEGRNDELYRYGCSLQSASRPDEEIEGLMYAYNKGHFDPPLDEPEFLKCVRNVLENVPKGHSEEVKQQEKRGRGRPRKFDHASIAEKLIEKNGACMIDGMPAIRHGNTYKIGWNAVNKEIILLDRNATRVNQREVQHYLNVMAEQKVQSPPNLIAFENGVLDIKTMQLRDYEETDVIPNVIPCDWNESAECEAVDNVLRKMSCGDDAVFESLIEVMGVCMYRSSEFTQSAILLGDGSNGKSTFIRMLTALLGKNNISTISMTQLGKNFLTGRLAGKLANLGSEISNEFKTGDLLSVFKELVDGNRMHADVKGVEGFDFENYATIVLCANEFPKLSDSTDGMMRRIFPIEFNARFRKTDPDYNPRIIHEVSSHEACEYMALLGVLGLQQVIKNNGFTPNAASDRRLEEIKAENDTALAWIQHCEWTTDDLANTPTSKHYSNYKEWCMEYGYQAYGHNKFTKLINKHLNLECKKKRVNGVPMNCFQKRNISNTN